MAESAPIPTGAGPTAEAPSWVETPRLCVALGVSRSTLWRWRGRKLLRQGTHWARKNPSAPRSDHLWHLDRCRKAIQTMGGRSGERDA